MGVLDRGKSISKGTAVQRQWAVTRSTSSQALVKKLSKKHKVEGGDRDETQESKSVEDRTWVYSKELTAEPRTDTCTLMFTAALLTQPEDGINPNVHQQKNR